ncbi:hypothetical protein D918_01087 [Trichuris suis]|nr:hypothetical protein D918_01087 [Trichuris suis]
MVMETIANGTTWTMFFPAKIPKALDKSTLTYLEKRRSSLLEEAKTVSDIYCTRLALKELKGHKNAGRATLEELHHRCRHVDTNLSERDPYYCLAYLEK